jgi:hypothetical protein
LINGLQLLGCCARECSFGKERALCQNFEAHDKHWIAHKRFDDSTQFRMGIQNVLKNNEKSKTRNNNISDSNKMTAKHSKAC